MRYVAEHAAFLKGEGRFDALFTGWGTITYDADWAMWFNFHTPNRVGFSNPEVDKLLEQGRAAINPREAERNSGWTSLIPVVTLLGLQVGTILGGAVITESVFAWPGIGSLAIQAIFNRDYPLVQAIVLISAVIFVVINYCLDALYCFLDPRIRLSG